MNNLVIGNTSQLSHYFPNDYIKISSRNIDFNYLQNNIWNSVYITFAEQRIYDTNIDFITPNYIYTLQIIKSLINNCNRIICYTTCNLWSLCNQKLIILNTPSNFDLKDEYTLSKLLLWNKIKELRTLDSVYNKVIIIHPFRFVSVYKNPYFLFGKIIDSILNKKKITTGNLNFYSNLTHAKFVVEKSINATNDLLVGSGELTQMRLLTRLLYEKNNLDYKNFITEDKHITSNGDYHIPLPQWNYNTNNILNDTMEDIRKLSEI